MCYSKIVFQRKQLNQVLRRSKNARHNPEKERVLKRDEKKLKESKE